MDKMYYNGTDTAHVIISGPPSTPVNLSVIDSSSQQKLSNVVQLDPNGTGTFSFNLTSFSDGIYYAMVGQGYGSVKIGFGVGIIPSESGYLIHFNLPKSDYTPSEIIQIQGFAKPDSIVRMDLIDPSGVSENSTQVTSNSSGNFRMEISVPSSAVDGTWKLSASSGVNHTTLDVVIHSTNPIPPIPYSILRSAAPTLTPSENQTVVSIALSVPGLQNWSHDWQYVGIGFLGNNKVASGGFEWQYAMVNLKTPPNSGLIPCDIGWEAEVTVDMTTMKVVSADYPTMNSQCHGIVLTGGGPNTSEISPTIESPLKQFESGVSLDDITCKDGFFLAISNEKNPLCLKAGTISKLATRGFLYGINANETEMNYTTVLIPPGSENQASKNRYSPDIVNVVIGVNNTVRWVSQSDVGNTIVPDQPVEQSGKSFGSPGIIPPGKSYQFTFTQPGTYPYHTEPHPWMTGQVIVSQTSENTTRLNPVIDVISISGTNSPPNPGGPEIQLQLMNIGMKSVTNLNATLVLNNNYVFNFKDVTESNPLAPGHSASDTETLIGAGYTTEMTYPLIVAGIVNNEPFNYTLNIHIPYTNENGITNTKTNPFGITALIIYHPPLGCLSTGCPPNTFYLKINSNSTAYLLGYNICDDNSCTKNNNLSILLPINTALYPNYQSIGLPVNLQWKYGDTVNIQLEVSPNADNKTASLLDLGNSTIVP
jgi:plastocyanin